MFSWRRWKAAALPLDICGEYEMEPLQRVNKLLLVVFSRVIKKAMQSRSRKRNLQLVVDSHFTTYRAAACAFDVGDI